MSAPQQTLARLRELRLNPMADAYQRQLGQPNLHQLPFDERFGLIVEATTSQKESAKIKRLMKQARMPETAMLEEVDFRSGRGLDQKQIASLSSCEWVRRQQNIIITGATGVGKTWLGCAFGAQVCRLGMSAVFHKVSELWEEIAGADLDGSLRTLKTALIKPNLLILDDLGIGDITPLAGRVLLDVVDRRSKTGSLLITSQYESDHWHKFFPDPTVGDAVLDRITHQSHRLALEGDSMRKIRARKTMGDV